MWVINALQTRVQNSNNFYNKGTFPLRCCLYGYSCTLPVRWTFLPHVTIATFNLFCFRLISSCSHRISSRNQSWVSNNIAVGHSQMLLEDDIRSRVSWSGQTVQNRAVGRWIQLQRKGVTGRWESNRRMRKWKEDEEVTEGYGSGRRWSSDRGSRKWED